MTIHNATSQSITNSDSTPRVANQAGVGAGGAGQRSGDYVTVPAAAAAGSVFRLVRVKSNVVVQSLTFESEAQGAGKVQLGVYYADDQRDLAPGNSANLGLVVSGAVQFFSQGDIDCSSAVTPTNYCRCSINNKLIPLWQALGLATDPGGKFDICATVHTTDVTTGTGRLGIFVDFIEP